MLGDNLNKQATANSIARSRAFGVGFDAQLLLSSPLGRLTRLLLALIARPTLALLIVVRIGAAERHHRPRLPRQLLPARGRLATVLRLRHRGANQALRVGVRVALVRGVLRQLLNNVSRVIRANFNRARYEGLGGYLVALGHHGVQTDPDRYGKWQPETAAGPITTDLLTVGPVVFGVGNT